MEKHEEQKNELQEQKQGMNEQQQNMKEQESGNSAASPEKDKNSGETREWFLRGMKDGVPIAMGYFAVAFTLGISASKAGMSAFQASLMSGLMLASAGQFAAISMIVSGAGFLEMIITTIVVNMRYLLMSSALSQKVRRDKPFYHRFFMSYAVTDEIFGISMAVDGKLTPSYMYGAACVAAPGWVLGTCLGNLLGMIMPVRVMSAMNVAIYGMFLAIVIPPSRKSRIVAGVVAVSMLVSLIFSMTPVLKDISSGFQIIILTVLIAGAAAVLFPIEQKEEGSDHAA